ncbi:aspartate/glutamate racemase family protein [Variovorax guangxiensis]|uniref:aspartate/glutamate racemase family protein n=1 Tax=Variovorax guangxiensis TaxID=1775474 RepID=UPI00286495DD|nr:aspartate/glutamate racemase family protein [Variovorax guangxiensis]MDR6859935.1 Asp/Glu/hydantoin racemase [Variovorax guangxiensis]
MTRILVIVPFPLDAHNLAQRREQSRAVKLPSGTTLEYRTTRVAPSNYVSGHDSVIAELSILEVGLGAERESFDAVCIDTMSDTGMTALRAALAIPVIGPGRHAMLTAMMLGRRFSILTMWDAWQPLYRKTIAELGLQAHCASVRAANLQPDNRNLLAGKEEEVFPRLEDVALRCVHEDGADVIILGSTTMHQAHPHLAQRLPVPVVNPGPLSYALAEAAVRLRAPHSPRAYPPQAAPQPAWLAAVLEAGARADA